MGDVTNSPTFVDDPLSQLLVRYLAEADALQGDVHGLKLLREKYIAANPDAALELAQHFQNEDAFGDSFGRRSDRLPRFERYTDVTLIGRGAMGVVYKAFDRELKRSVALKVPSVEVAMSGDHQRLRAEAENLARLTHHNIVRVFDVAEHDGRTVISMELIEGGSLHDHADHFRNDPRALAALMVAIARGVHYAHQRGILHRDLKPSNVLLGGEPQDPSHPYVSDFGLATLIGTDELRLEAIREPGHETIAYGAIVGTASYMSPEQARGKRATTLSDVYGLGAILYSILTGRPPFRGDSAEATLEQVRDPARSADHPRIVHPTADRTLSAIAMKCLEKDPSRRYRSAEGLAKDLDRWLTHRRTEARPLGPAGRAGVWCRRNPVGAGRVLALLSLSLLAAADIGTRLGEPRRIRRTVAVQTAGLLQTRLNDMKRAVESTAQNPRLPDLLARGDQSQLQTLIESEGAGHVDLNGTFPFDTLLLVDSRNGAFVARWPKMDPDSEGQDFRARDYYEGLVSSTAPGAYVSRVFRAVTDELFKFGVSARVIRNGQTIGIVAATVTTDARMGLADLENESFVTSVLALRDSRLMPGETGLPPPGASSYVILLHPGYGRGIEPKWFPLDRLTDLRAGDVDDYRDPVTALGADVSRKYAGTWAASAAPVAGSPFFVMVQQRESPGPIGYGTLLILVVAALAVATVLAYVRLRSQSAANASTTR
jgi:serine/threonine protein kinase